MANKALIVASGMPVDVPGITKPGMLYREGEQPGAAKHLALPPEAMERAAKGDLGFGPLDQTFTSCYGAMDPAKPFKNLKGGR